jgi:hypothetical protein
MPRTSKRNSSSTEDARSSPAKRLRSSSNGTADQKAPNAAAAQNGHAKKQILLNAFDMSTVGHLSPGQWKVLLRDAVQL